MIPATADAYLPTSTASRGTLLSLIVAAHVLAGVAIASIKGVTVAIEQLPMRVTIIPDVAPPPVLEPTRTIPLPQMKMPEVRIPVPPQFETIQMVKMVEEAPAPVVAKAAPSPAPVATPAVAPGPATEPPRFDLAYLNNPAPAYPVFSKRTREQGVVFLRVRVDVTGNVEGIEIHKTSGHERLDQAALSAVKRWRFVPAKAGERTVAGVAIVPIHFQLEG